jgi:hypothetical protein
LQEYGRALLSGMHPEVRPQGRICRQGHENSMNASKCGRHRVVVVVAFCTPMSNVAITRHRQGPLYPRIASATKDVLRRGPVDVLIAMGLSRKMETDFAMPWGSGFLKGP